MPIRQEPPITEDFQTAGNSIYAVTKLMGELYIRQSNSPWMILRYAHLYGAEKRGHGLIGGFVERIERGLAPTLYGGRQSNDFTYIADVARANRLALEASYDRWGEVYNIGTGEELSAEDAGQAVCKAWGYSGDTLVIPSRSVDPERFVYDTAKATRMLGFTAEYNFAKGLADMARTGEAAALHVA
jgi:nucleoside-diphosphate-sugar epimerase